MLGSESGLLKAGVHPGNKLLALSVHRQWQGASSLGWQPGQLLLQEQVDCTSQRLSLQSKLCTLISPCSDQGTLRAPKGRRCSHLALQHCKGATTLETICSLHTLNAEQERWVPVSM